jgi:predicted adenine nucleotide alpha hydrolase (AANH) superfamily ATPase
MRVLLHVCCGPCAIMPLRRLLDEGHEVLGFFYNPNIQPLAEYLRRRAGAAQVAEKYGIKMRWALEEGDYDTAAWLRRVAAAGPPAASERCPECWRERLARAFELAAREGFDAVTSSLLYSRRQRHAEIAALGRELAAGFAGVSFLYRDWRPDWRRGIEISKEWSLYRQQYCGCIFSENDRYAGELRKANAVLS